MKYTVSETLVFIDVLCTATHFAYKHSYLIEIYQVNVQVRPSPSQLMRREFHAEGKRLADVMILARQPGRSKALVSRVESCGSENSLKNISTVGSRYGLGT